uniref:Uncharacterized protein n=1 Tax=Tetraselmis chuii TaxID=63592 RepID=A0A7S1SVG4_9CHLO|mmetsp:Transcript_31569/g.56497  ORF Transcript_31569/g.56497 Transcript_31569/m.56497 type:complete len:415 (+) Transcript_31569:233-1477(+)
MGTALETRARRQPWLLAILLCAAVQGISSYTSLPIFFSGSGRTAPVKKGKVELPPLHYLHDLHLPPIEPQKALELYHRMLPGARDHGERGIIMYGEGQNLQHGVTIISRAAHVASRALLSHPWLNITIFTTRQTFTAWAALRSQQGHTTAYPFHSALFFEDIQTPALLRYSSVGNTSHTSLAESTAMQQSKLFFQRKIAAMQLSPYNRTLYMDPDTCVCGAPGSLEELFEELEEYDLATAMEWPAAVEPVPHIYAHYIPEKIQERYWGLVFYRKSEPMMHFLDTVMELYVTAANRNLGHRNDQQAVREAVFLEKGQLMERTLSEKKELCRAHSGRAKGDAKQQCAKPPSLCAKGCAIVQDRCECWATPRVGSKGSGKGSSKSKKGAGTGGAVLPSSLPPPFDPLHHERFPFLNL